MEPIGRPITSSIGTIAPSSQLILGQNRFWNYGREPIDHRHNTRSSASLVSSPLSIIAQARVVVRHRREYMRADPLAGIAIA